MGRSMACSTAMNGDGARLGKPANDELRSRPPSSRASSPMNDWPRGRFFPIKAFCISTSAAISPRSAGPTSFHNFLPTLSCGLTI